jgi:hypothetical protein
MLREHRHVDDMEVPSAVPDDAAHADEGGCFQMDYGYRGPPAVQSRGRLVRPARGQPGAFPQGQVFRQRRRAVQQPVTGRQTVQGAVLGTVSLGHGSKIADALRQVNAAV